MEVVIATRNKGKIAEFREMLAGTGHQWRDLSEFPATTDVPETGDTFEENACLKASGYATQLSTWALADDSGLAVDALDGSPGVLSARWAQVQGAGSGDADNNATLLRQLQGVEPARRSARFVCVLALADPQGEIVLTARDTVEGRILEKARGANGFGYDPLFWIESLGRTTAELPPAEKHRISHRGKALVRLRELMTRTNLG